MSEITETPSAEEAAEVAVPLTPETFDASQSFADESRISDGAGFVSVLKDWAGRAAQAVTEAVRATNAAKRLAEARVEARSFIIRASGFPDWQADSDAYSQAVQAAEATVFAKLGPDGKRRLDQSVRQHVKRNYLEPGIARYVLTNEANFGEELEKFKNDPASVLSAPSEALIKRVNAHYTAAGLTINDGSAFKRKESASSPGPTPGDAPGALSALNEALGGLVNVVPKFSVLGVLRTVTDISRKLMEGKISDVESRPAVIKNLHRISTVCTLTAKALEGKGEEADEKILASAYFSEKDDKLD